MLRLFASRVKDIFGELFQALPPPFSLAPSAFRIMPFPHAPRNETYLAFTASHAQKKRELSPARVYIPRYFLVLQFLFLFHVPCRHIENISAGSVTIGVSRECNFRFG